MNSKSDGDHVVGVFRSRHDADACFSALLNRGYAPSEVSVMMSDKVRARDYAWKESAVGAAAARGSVLPRNTSPEPSLPEGERSVSTGSQAHSKAAEGTALGGSIGTAVGAGLAALAAVGTTLAVPGLNLVVAGPIVAALAGGGAGAVTGGVIGGFIGMGIPEQDAEVYNKALADGGVVMGVKARTADDAKDVKALMLSHSGEQVACCSC